MQTLLKIGCLLATAGVTAMAGRAGEMNVNVDYSWPTQWSAPVAGPNGLIIPSVPTRFDRVSVGSHLQTPTPGIGYIPQTAPRPAPPLVQAAATGDVRAVTALLATGADLNAANGHGDNALMTAAAGGHMAVVKLLLAKGAEVNDANQDGQTALLQATRRGQTQVVALLLEHKADPVVLDETGKMALDYARASTNKALVVLLTASTR